MANFESRLKALEKRAALDYEAMHNVDGRAKAYRVIIDALAAPICASTPEILPVIIKNLEAYEREAKLQNSHVATLAELRGAREFFESLAKRMTQRSASKSSAAPRHGK